MNIKDFGLGRIIVNDNNDNNYSISSVLPKTINNTYKYWWTNGWWGNQGNSPMCVAYSWNHWLADGPITQLSSRNKTKYPFDIDKLYTESQKVDEWPGENYNGTSVRAGAKILKKYGYIKNYYWAWDIETTINAILTMGPVVIGSHWYYNMFFPDKNGIIKPTGRIVGGHAYLLDGINTKKQLIRIKNSWGRNWGHNGFAYISFDDLSKLISENGEVCLATEIDVI
jgi:hypothetical protein